MTLAPIPAALLARFSLWLMLDFDGVLHPNCPMPGRPEAEQQLWCYIPRLEAVLRRHTHVGIVITSSHRKDTSLSVMSRRFSPDIRERIVGVTPVLPDGSAGPGARQTEVQAWLDAYGQQNIPWVALDDIIDLYTTGASVVEAKDGFRDQETADLDCALNDPSAWAKSHPVPPAWMPRTLWVPGC